MLYNSVAVKWSSVHYVHSSFPLPLPRTRRKWRLLGAMSIFRMNSVCDTHSIPLKKQTTYSRLRIHNTHSHTYAYVLYVSSKLWTTIRTPSETVHKIFCWCRLGTFSPVKNYWLKCNFVAHRFQPILLSLLNVNIFDWIIGLDWIISGSLCSSRTLY